MVYDLYPLSTLSLARSLYRGEQEEGKKPKTITMANEDDKKNPIKLNETERLVAIGTIWHL